MPPSCICLLGELKPCLRLLSETHPPPSDLDLVVESKSMAYSNTSSVLHALASVVKRAGIADRVSIIAKAKVPIIKFVTRHCRFSVDISINHVNGVTTGNIVKKFVKELPALRPLVLVVKSFLSQRSMNEVYTGGLGSYSIVCLIISFLQLHPKIRRGEMDAMKNLGVLVMEFFELYGCYFNYQDVGISVRDGGSYFNKARRGWADYHAPGLLSIEDPDEPCTSRLTSFYVSLPGLIFPNSERYLTRIFQYRKSPNYLRRSFQHHDHESVQSCKHDLG